MSDRPTPRRAAWCSLAVASLLLVAGCTGASDNASSGNPSAASTPGPSDTASATQSDPSSTAPASTTPSSASSDISPAASPPATSPPVTSAPQQVLASRDFTVTGTYSRTPVKMRFTVVELKRRGDLLDLTASLTNLEKDGSRDLRWQVSDRFQGPYRKDITGIGGAFSGAVLTDLPGKKRYLVAADSGSACVCTVELSSAFVGAGQSIELNATYAAPPAATTKLDVAVTSVGNFRDLPIT